MLRSFTLVCMLLLQCMLPVNAQVRANKHVSKRYWARSDTGGQNWTQIVPGMLPAPTCNAAAINLHGARQMALAHIEPGLGSTVREHMTIRVSEDGGSTFPVKQLVWAPPAGYITLTTTANTSVVGALYENGGEGQSCYRRISYQEIAISSSP
jgi:hypothetical protein